MKLAEALIQRADAQRRINQLRERLMRSVKVQEGEDPPENPTDLFTELDRVLSEFNTLIKQINRTNSVTRFDDTRTLTDALADRDTMKLELGVLYVALNTAATRDFRYGRAEIRAVSTINVADLQRQIDDLARRHRELDAAVQALNWTVDLIE